MDMETPNNRGFTLIELLVVIAIIGLLSTMITVALVNARRESWCDKQGITDDMRCEAKYEDYLKQGAKGDCVCS